MPSVSVLPAPVAEHERLHVLDVLRAVALFGVFLINVEFMARPAAAAGYGMEPGLDGLDHAIAWLEYTFVHGKAWLLFSLLFGAGFAVMAQRAERAGRDFTRLYLRRTGILLAFGAAHVALLWDGDILHTYAVAALVLLAILRGRTGLLLIAMGGFVAATVLVGGRAMLGGVIGFALFALASAWLRRGEVDRVWKAGAALYVATATIILVMSLPSAFSTPDAAEQAAIAARLSAFDAQLAQQQSVNLAGDYLATVAQRWQELRMQWPRETALGVFVVGAFLIGVWAVRAGVVAAPQAHRPLLRRGVRIALPSGALLALASVLLADRYDPLQQPFFQVASQLMTLAALPLALGYAALVMLWAADGRGGAWLVPAGRMALSNYLLQSLIGTLVFHGHGLGLGGALGRGGQLLLVLVVFALQLVASRWWLRTHAHGPMEWLWRAGTYGRWPAWRRESRPERPIVLRGEASN